MRVVDAVRVLVADRLGGENREHERNNQLHRTRRLHDEDGD